MNLIAMFVILNIALLHVLINASSIPSIDHNKLSRGRGPMIPDDNGSIALRSTFNETTPLEKRYQAPLNFERDFPHDRVATVNKFYDDAVSLAKAGLKAAKSPTNEPFTRYFHQYDSRWVANVFNAWLNSATEAGTISDIQTVWIDDGEHTYICEPAGNTITYMALSGNSDHHRPYETWIYMCPDAWTTFNVFLHDRDCAYARANWPLTNFNMRTGGAAFLHEWLHYDVITLESNGMKIRDQTLRGPAPDGGRRAYGPYLSMLYRDFPHTYIAPRDNDENFIWMAIEAFWMDRCHGYKPGPPVDAPAVQPGEDAGHPIAP